MKIKNSIVPLALLAVGLIVSACGNDATTATPTTDPEYLLQLETDARLSEAYYEQTSALWAEARPIYERLHQPGSTLVASVLNQPEEVRAMVVQLRSLNDRNDSIPQPSWMVGDDTLSAQQDEFVDSFSYGAVALFLELALDQYEEGNNIAATLLFGLVDERVSFELSPPIYYGEPEYFEDLRYER